MALPTYRFPAHLAKGAEFAPTFMNSIQPMVSGKERRVMLWEDCRVTADIGIVLREIRDTTLQLNYIRQVDAIFKAHRAHIYPFRIIDPFDHTATDERFGTGNGVRTTWQLIKTYDPQKAILGTDGTLVYVRNILLPGTPIIKVDGVTKTVTTDYTIGPTGEVTFTSPPADTKPLTWSTTGDGHEILMRFDTDKLEIRMMTGRHAQIGRIPLIELIDPAEITG